MGYECVRANGGTSFQTPHLDELASTGARFTHCYSQPLCTPSRVKIMTGMSNFRNYVQFGVLDRKQTTFAHLLKKEGYTTCIVGSGNWARRSILPSTSDLMSPASGNTPVRPEIRGRIPATPTPTSKSTASQRLQQWRIWARCGHRLPLRFHRTQPGPPLPRLLSHDSSP